jgi:hypothetical protein
MPAALTVGVETGQKRVFAFVVDWPGWCRSGRDEPGALDALGAYAARYAAVAAEAGLALAPERPDLRVGERVPGSTTTDVGAPGSVASSDGAPLDAGAAGRQAALLAACWRVLDRVAAGAPAELRKGPRGGGRDRDQIVEHVVGAEVAYARKLGLRLRQPPAGDAGALAAHREAILEALRVPSDGSPPVPKGWPPRYAVRRLAWHALDHAWEIEDRSEAGPG